MVGKIVKKYGEISQHIVTGYVVELPKGEFQVEIPKILLDEEKDKIIENLKTLKGFNFNKGVKMPIGSFDEDDDGLDDFLSEISKTDDVSDEDDIAKDIFDTDDLEDDLEGDDDTDENSNLDGLGDDD